MPPMDRRGFRDSVQVSRGARTIPSARASLPAVVGCGHVRTASRNRRVKRAAIALIAVIVLLEYPSAYLAWRLAGGNVTPGTVQYYNSVNQRIDPIWEPLRRYEQSDLPLSTELFALERWCRNGGRNTWADEHRRAARIKQLTQNGSRSRYPRRLPSVRTISD
jgi:hypothetical protein